MLTRRNKNPYIAAHRGVSGANIPCNTKAAYEIAIRQGADIIEIDVASDRDGELYIFHPGMEKPHLGIDGSLSDMTAAEISKLRYTNQDNVPTSYKITPLKEMLEFLRNRAYINIDKFYEYPEKITYEIYKCGVENQTIVKTLDDVNFLDVMEKYAPDIAFMPMISHIDNFTDYALERNVKYLGIEVLFQNESDPIAVDEYITKMHNLGLLMYGDSIVYNEKDVISAGHTDDLALSGSPDKGWGWFVDKDFDIIQTDWCGELKNYLDKRGM